MDFYSIAEKIAEVSVLVILAMYSIVFGGRRIAEMFGYKFRPPETAESNVLANLSENLNTTVNALTNTFQQINNIMTRIERLSEQILSSEQRGSER